MSAAEAKSTSGFKDPTHDEPNGEASVRPGQFKPGQSGNPKGRPRKVKDRLMPMQHELAKPVKIKGADGKTEVVIVQEALRRRLLAQALSGNMTAMKTLLQYCPDMLTVDVRPVLEQRQSSGENSLERILKHMSLSAKQELRQAFINVREEAAAYKEATQARDRLPSRRN